MISVAGSVYLNFCVLFSGKLMWSLYYVNCPSQLYTGYVRRMKFDKITKQRFIVFFHNDLSVPLMKSVFLMLPKSSSIAWRQYTVIVPLFRVWKWWMQPPAHAGSSLADFSTLKMEVIRSSETSVHTGSTRLHILQYDILHSHLRENLSPYIYDPSP
jgi:hypothetical protein